MRTERLVRLAGMFVGLALAALAIASWRIPTTSSRTVGADLRMVAFTGGELSVSKPGVFLGAVNLKPGGAARAESGTVVLANRGTKSVSVRMRARPSVHDLDRLLQVRVRVAGGGGEDADERMFRGTLGGLRDWTAREFRLAKGERRAIEARVWLPRSAQDGYQGVSVDVTLELENGPRGP